MDGNLLKSLWNHLDATICEKFYMDKKREDYVINTDVDFGKVASQIDKILHELLYTLSKSFPGIFTTEKIRITYKHIRSTRSPILSMHNSRSTRRKGSASPHSGRSLRSTAPVQGLWYVFGIARSEREWKTKPINNSNKTLDAFIKTILDCNTTPEKFCVVPLTWDLITKWGGSSSHYSCVIVDTSSERSRSNMSLDVTIVDVNGYGGSSSAYKNVFDQPTMGLNVLIRCMFEKIIAYTANRLGVVKWSVKFPSFSGINVRRDAAISAKKFDLQYFPFENIKNVDMESGVCAIATLFVIIRLACDQRRVFREGIDRTLKRFTSNSHEYQHIMVIRSFTYILLEFLGLAKTTYGIRGRSLLIHPSDWMKKTM